MEVMVRTEVGKNANRRLRASGRVPGNVYGMGLAPFTISVEAKRVGEVLHLASGQNTIINLIAAGGSEKRDVIIKELQLDPVSGRFVHVDFVRIDPNQPIQVNVPIRLSGLPEGVKNEGGILDHVMREVNVSCLPADIPEQFDVDTSELHLNQNLSISDISVGEGITILDDPQSIIAVVSPARVEEVAPTEGEEEDEAGEEAAAEGESPEAAAESTEKTE